jgi:hypothetical protein
MTRAMHHAYMYICTYVFRYSTPNEACLHLLRWKSMYFIYIQATLKSIPRGN